MNQHSAGLRIADTSSQDVAVAPQRRWRHAYGAAALVLGAVVLVFVALPALQRWASAEISLPRDRLRLATVVRGDLIRDVSVQGRVVAAVSPTVYAAEGGTVTFQVNAGDTVQAGQTLAVVDSPELDNRLQQAGALLARLEVELERQRIETKQQNLANQKTVDVAKLQLTAAQRESRRANEAYARDVISQLDHEKAQDELETAQYAHSHAVADAALDSERLAFEQRTKTLEVDQQALAVTELQRQVDALTLVSPVSGVVGNLLVTQKTNVSRNQALASVVDLSQFEIEVQVPESYADDLAIGMPAEVNVGGQAYAAMLISVSPEIIDNQVTARLRFGEAGGPPGLRQNQRLTTRVLLEAHNGVLTVPRGQFLESGGGRIAYVVTDGMAHRRGIEIGARSLNAVEVLSGLSEGDQIVISSTDAFEGADTVLITD